jgi:phosphatidate cytidylyltransferase
LIAGVLTLVPAWAALGWLHLGDPGAPRLLLFVLLLTVAADTAAYFAGHAFGRTRLAPAISPGKTVEGVAGGVAGVVLLAYFYGTMVVDLHGSALALWLALAAASGLVSVLGDLNESKLKRIAGAKDSGTLLPGHGGVLDRIDALTAAAPTFAWGWLILFDARA